MFVSPPLQHWNVNPMRGSVSVLFSGVFQKPRTTVLEHKSTSKNVSSFATFLCGFSCRDAYLSYTGAGQLYCFLEHRDIAFPSDPPPGTFRQMSHSGWLQILAGLAALPFWERTAFSTHGIKPELLWGGHQRPHLTHCHCHLAHGEAITGPPGRNW